MRKIVKIITHKLIRDIEAETIAFAKEFINIVAGITRLRLQVKYGCRSHN
ncbi:MAG: hypothetical protein ACP5NC_04380 [Nitrososphaeria archaeon]